LRGAIYLLKEQRKNLQSKQLILCAVHHSSLRQTQHRNSSYTLHQSAANMNAFSKYGTELLSKMGMKTNSSGDSLVSLPQSMKKAKFIKRFDMKVTTLQSYGLLRRDTPSPIQTSYNGSVSSKNKNDAGKKAVVNVHSVHSHEHPKDNTIKEMITHVNEYPIDPNNVVASIHRNMKLQKQVAVSDHITFIESRDDVNELEIDELDGREGDTVDSRRVIEENEKDEFLLGDDCDSVDSLWNDCIQATCNLSVDDIYNDDELLGLAFVRD
jgi:uncharacterized protein YlxP (DUF503 family)